MHTAKQIEAKAASSYPKGGQDFGGVVATRGAANDQRRSGISSQRLLEHTRELGVTVRNVRGRGVREGVDDITCGSDCKASTFKEGLRFNGSMPRRTRSMPNDSSSSSDDNNGSNRWFDSAAPKHYHAGDTNAPSADRDLLIIFASSSCWPEAPVLRTISDPARSTR